MKNTKTLGRMLQAVLLACILLLAGCAQTGNPITASTSAQTGATSAPEQTTAQTATQKTVPTAAAPVEFSYWGYWCANAVDGNYCEKLIEDALNIKIKTINVSQNDTDQVNLMLSAGGMPDCGWFMKNIDYMYNQNGLTRTIPKDMVSQYCPGYVELFNNTPVLEKIVTTKEDESQYYALPTYQANIAGHQYFFTDFYRKDWLDKLGIAMPGNVTKVEDGVYMSDTGYTLAQHKAILEAFTKDDPDGDGKADTVGTIGAGVTGLGPISYTMLGAWGLTPSYSVDDNGKAVYYYSTDRYKQLLAYVRDLYKEGVIDPEILTLTGAQFYEKAKNSAGGHFNVSTNYLGSWASDRPPVVVLKNVSGSEFLITPGLVGPDGKMGSAYGGALPEWNGDTFFYVNKNVTDDNKLAAILQFVQFANFGPDKIQLMFGEPNVDYTLDADGMPVRSTTFTEENEKGIQAYSLCIQDAKQLSWGNDSMFRPTAAFTLPGGSWLQYLIPPYKYDAFNTTDIASLTNQYGSDLNTIVSEFATSVISGQADLDAGWNDYLTKLNNAGYDKICAELDKAPLYSDVISGK